MVHDPFARRIGPALTLGACLALGACGGEGGPAGGDSGTNVPDVPDIAAAQGDSGTTPTAPLAPEAGPIPVEDIACGSFDADERASLLASVNQVRATARACGDVRAEAAPPVRWNEALTRAAIGHSKDMARHNFFSHTGSDGGGSAARAEATGYRYRALGENIAAGQANARQALEGWVDSPGHCTNLMSAGYDEMGLACVRDVNADYGEYWTQVFGRAR